MSYGIPSQSNQPAPRRGGGGGMLLLIMIAVGAFLLFSRNGQPAPKSSSEPGIKQGAAEGLDGDFVESRSEKTDQPRKGVAMPGSGRDRTAGGRDSEQVGQSSKTMPSSYGKKTTGDNGWSGEQVDTNPQKDDGVGLRLSNEPTNTPMLEDNDWSSEQVPKKKSVTNGDWEAEAVNPRN